MIGRVFVRSFNVNTTCSLFHKCSLSSRPALCQEWRRERGLPENPNRDPLLMDSPDYTFLDGRPVPYGSRQKQRLAKQQKYTERIIKLTSEVDFALQRHQRLVKEKEDQAKRALAQKLTTKGKQILKTPAQ